MIKRILSSFQKQYLVLAVIFFFLAVWMFTLEDRMGDESLAEAISPNILRFHVLASSDSEEDQAVKLQVRDYFLNLLHRELAETADKATILSYIETQKSTLETKLDAFLQQLGSSDTAVLEIADVYFPERIYGEFVFPCGQYEALRIKIGEAKGHNWWCVLYPSLCFTDESGPYLPPSSCVLLEDLVGEGTYQDMLSQKPNTININIESFLVKKWKQLVTSS